MKRHLRGARCVKEHLNHMVAQHPSDQSCRVGTYLGLWFCCDTCKGITEPNRELNDIVFTPGSCSLATKRRCRPGFLQGGIARGRSASPG